MKRINISTKCNCCIKEDVCKYKQEYEDAVESILNAGWNSSDGGYFTQLRDSQIVSVSIKCNKILPHSATPKISKIKG